MVKKMLFALLVVFASCQNNDKKAAATTPETAQQAIVTTPKDIAVALDSARCFGNEPFWDIEISEKKGTITFNNVSKEFVHTFPYAEPKIEDEQAIYNAVEGKNTLVITLKREQCSDGMSDVVHKYSSEIVHNGKKFKGCGCKKSSVYLRMTT